MTVPSLKSLRCEDGAGMGESGGSYGDVVPQKEKPHKQNWKCTCVCTSKEAARSRVRVGYCCGWIGEVFSASELMVYVSLSEDPSGRPTFTCLLGNQRE